MSRSDDKVVENLTALARSGGMAGSLRQARPCQTLVVGSDGSVLAPLSAENLLACLRPLATVVVTATVMMIAGAAMFGAGGGPALVMATLVGAVMWAQPRYELDRALALHGAGELVDAQATALRVAGSRWAGRMVRGNAGLVAGATTWLRGDLDAALATTRNALVDLGYPREGSWRGVAAMARLQEIQLLAITGKLAEARRRFAELEADGIPGGDLVQMQLIDTQLVLAFEAGHPHELPHELDEWLDTVLRTNRFGSTLALLAWAHIERGDTELVPTMLDVAADRIAECRIEHAHPRLAQWLAERRD
ncbi:MAG TPA: hypothetical protein VFG69_10060 [Nannocystaceae bacterium]|nr:hypothetical protein [Nannocystaceae bacterium]